MSLNYCIVHWFYNLHFLNSRIFRIDFTVSVYPVFVYTWYIILRLTIAPFIKTIRTRNVGTYRFIM